jgi:type IV secretory pathway VirB4 component
MSTADKSLASIIPYGHILDDGTVYLRGRGWMIGFEFHGLPWESSTQAQLESASERMTAALRHLGSGDTASMSRKRVAPGSWKAIAANR